MSHPHPSRQAVTSRLGTAALARAVVIGVAVSPLIVLTSAASATAEVAPAQPADRTVVYAHMPNATAAEIEERIDLGWATGAFLYYSERETFGWSPQWTAIADTFPDGVALFVSPKTWTKASLTDWCERLSPAQRRHTVFAHWQEPEDNFTTDAARASFRDRVEQAAAIVQPFGIRNGVHLQSWTLNDANTNGWAGRANFKAFIPDDASAVDIVGISLYDEHQNYSGPDQLRPVHTLLERELPRADWAPVASGWSVPTGTGAGSPLRAERALAAADGLDYARRHGASAYGWFDFTDWERRDYGVAGDPALLAMLRRL